MRGRDEIERAFAISKVALWGLLLVSVLPVSARGIDLSGRWRLEVDSQGNAPVVGLADVTQMGTTATIPLPAVPPDPAFTFSGTVGAHFSLPWTGPFSILLAGFAPNDDAFIASVLDSSSTGLALYTVLGTRCECDDGNLVGGDGCDAYCRVEPCYTCTPPPSSVCAPLGDGASCEDGTPARRGRCVRRVLVAGARRLPRAST